MTCKKGILISILGTFILLHFVPSNALAWKVTIINKTDKRVEVVLENFKIKNAGINATISPQGYYTFDTGALCPSYMSGKVEISSNV